VETMLKLSREIDTVKVGNSQFVKSTCTMNLTTKTKEIIELEQGISG
jgi:dTDP-4-dehydrorhamnose reductase